MFFFLCVFLAWSFFHKWRAWISPKSCRTRRCLWLSTFDHLWILQSLERMTFQAFRWNFIRTTCFFAIWKPAAVLNQHGRRLRGPWRPRCPLGSSMPPRSRSTAGCGQPLRQGGGLRRDGRSGGHVGGFPAGKAVQSEGYRGGDATGVVGGGSGRICEEFDTWTTRRIEEIVPRGGCGDRGIEVSSWGLKGLGAGGCVLMSKLLLWNFDFNLFSTIWSPEAGLFTSSLWYFVMLIMWHPLSPCHSTDSVIELAMTWIWLHIAIMTGHAADAWNTAHAARTIISRGEFCFLLFARRIVTSWG